MTLLGMDPSRVRVCWKRHWHYLARDVFALAFDVSSVMTRSDKGSPSTSLLCVLLLLSMGCPLLLDDEFQNVQGRAGTSGLGGSRGGETGMMGGGAASLGGASSTAGASAGSPSSGNGSGGAGSGGTDAGTSSGGTQAGTSGADGADAGSSCEDGASRGPNGDCYLVVGELLSWQSARSHCQGHRPGWDLAAIRSAADSAFLAGILTDEVWVGADDTNGTEVWRWVSDGTEFWQGGADGSALGDPYLDWNANEPNGGGGADCMRILPTALWADLDCGTERAFVCEGPTD